MKARRIILFSLIGVFTALVAIALIFFLYQPWQTYKGMTVSQWITFLSKTPSKGVFETKLDQWTWWFKNGNLPRINPTLRLTQIVTGSEPHRYTFELPLNHDLAKNCGFLPDESGQRDVIGMLRLVIENGGASLLGQYDRSSDGKILLYWYPGGDLDDSVFKPGSHRLHAYFLINPSRSGGTSTMEAIGPDIMVTVPGNAPPSKQ